MASMNPTQVVAAMQILALKFKRGRIDWRTEGGPRWRVRTAGRVCDGRTLVEALEKMLAETGR